MNTRKELASKDCRVCNRRRVKCDRALPTCGKCEKRGLVCSGYGVILKWDQGVASRGNLTGKALPVKETQAALPVFNVAGIPLETEHHRSDDEFQPIPTTFQVEKSTIPMPLVPSQLENPAERRLLYHYNHNVAPNMAWLDCSENPWRSVIVPLALESPPLLNAILAFAAKHINAVTFATSKNTLQVAPVSQPHGFQQQAIKLLAREIQELASAKFGPSSVPRNRSNALLATMLVLCNVETVWPDSPVWQLHLNAARTVIASNQDRASRPVDEDSTSIFLQEELFIANTFASTTDFLNFTPSEDYRLNTAIAQPSGIFIEFLKLLQMVTSLERQASTNPTALVSSGISSTGLRQLFESARCRTLKLGKSFQMSSADDHLHLSRTVNCFYHAGLIYSYRALLKDYSLGSDHVEDKETQTSISKVELFKALGFTETSKPMFAQDLVWPLFIAGTEATQVVEQDMVVAKLQQAMSETGFSNCQHALEFLKALWGRRAAGMDLETKFDWIAFAREWTGQGKTFLVF